MSCAADHEGRHRASTAGRIPMSASTGTTEIVLTLPAMTDHGNAAPNG